MVLPSLPGSPPALEPPSPRSGNVNKASFHVFIELLPLRHFPGTIRPFEGLGQFGSQAGAGVENGPRPRPRPRAELVPSYPYRVQTGEGQEPRGQGRPCGLDLACSSAEWGEQSPLPPPWAAAAGKCRVWDSGSQSVQDCPGAGTEAPHAVPQPWQPSPSFPLCSQRYFMSSPEFCAGTVLCVRFGEACFPVTVSLCLVFSVEPEARSPLLSGLTPRGRTVPWPPDKNCPRGPLWCLFPVYQSCGGPCGPLREG